MYKGAASIPNGHNFRNFVEKFSSMYVYTYIHTDVCLASTVRCIEKENNSGGTIYHFKR